MGHSVCGLSLLHFIFVLASLDLGFAMLCALHGLVLTWPHPSLLGIDWVWPFAFPCFYAFSLHTCLHVHAWVCVSSILQSNGTLDIWSKPTFVLQGHPFLFDNLFVCLFVRVTCLFAPIWHLFLACHLACFPSIHFFAYLLACFLVCCMYTHGARVLGVRARPLRHK